MLINWYRFSSPVSFYPLAGSLSYAAGSDQYTYIWKTEKTWANTCRQFVLRLKDGSAHRANFKFD